MVEFIFTQEQRLLAQAEGFRRQAANVARDLRGRNNAPVSGLEAETMHLIGAAGEMAVGCYLDLKEYLYQDIRPVRGSCDLPGIDVKTRTKHWHDLLVQLDDDPSKKFVLVTIQDRRTFIHGWIHGVDCMKESFIRTFKIGRTCYAVPKEQLRPIEELKCLMEAVSRERIAG
jgi:hypothetical protein